MDPQGAFKSVEENNIQRTDRKEKEGKKAWCSSDTLFSYLVRQNWLED